MKNDRETVRIHDNSYAAASEQGQGLQGFEIYVDRFWTGEARSGRYGCVIGAGYNYKLAGGAICEMKQKVAIGSKPLPGPQ